MDAGVLPPQAYIRWADRVGRRGHRHHRTEAGEAASRAADQRLAESERQYRELVELANSIILRWTSEGIITFLNEFGLRFFGYSATEILGRHVMDTIVPPTESDGRDLRQLMEQICANPKAFEQNVNENMLSKRGSRLDCLDQ